MMEPLERQLWEAAAVLLQRKAHWYAQGIDANGLTVATQRNRARLYREARIFLFGLLAEQSE